MYGMRPALARPAARDTEFVSAMPHSMYRSGNFAMNSATVLDMSAARVTIRSSSAPSSVTAKPAGFAVIAVSRSTSLKTSTIFFSAIGQLHPGRDLRDHVRVLLGVEQAKVPSLRLLLHELDAVPLARPRDDRHRLLAAGIRKFIESPQ